MPIYTYTCKTCEKSVRKLMSKKTDSISCDCGANMDFQLPSTVAFEVYETRDNYQGTQLPKNHKAKLKERFTKHHDAYEIAKKIDQHGMDDAEKYGWIKKEKKVL